MACGCKKGNRGAHSLRPTTTVRSTAGGIAAGPTPTQVHAQALAQTQTPLPVKNAAGLSAERRKTQAIRRDAIRKAFNK